MTKPDSLNITPAQALYALGYSLTSTWATVLLFSSFFSTAASSRIVTASMLSGVVACLGVLLLRAKVPAFDGRTPAASVYATGMAVGTLMCTFPPLTDIPLVHAAGLAISGFFAILLILTWFEVFARLAARTIVLLAGIALVTSALGCFAVLSLPVEVASVVMAALPIISFSLLPRSAGQSASGGAGAPASPSLGVVLREAVSWKTLLGVVISFFVIGAIGAIAPELGMHVELSAVYLLIPVALCAVFAAIALAAPARIDGSVLFKLLLVGIATLAFVLVYVGTTNLTLVFFIYITADVLLWTVLALASKKTPVAPHVVFATGWLAECAGNVLGHNVTTAMGNTPYLFALVMVLILVAVGFAFGDGLFVLELEGVSGGTEANDTPATVTGVSGGTEEIDTLPYVPSPATPPPGLDAAQLTASESSDTCDLAGPGVGQGASSSEEAESASPVTADSVSPAPAPVAGADPIAAFVASHGLSEREADVFALWVTGHGLKYIQDTLFISESTVKTHLRSIYRKCGTHNRAEIIDLFEREG